MRAQQSLSTVSGRIIRLGDDIDTDLIYPGKYVPLVDPDQWAAHALEGIDPGFPARIQQNDIIVAGKNFGCGSSRSQAVSCLKAAGIGAIVAVLWHGYFFETASTRDCRLWCVPRPSEFQVTRLKLILKRPKSGGVGWNSLLIPNLIF